MESTLKLSIVTPNGSIFDGNIKSVIMPGINGEFGVIPNHSSLVTSLDVGVIEITNIDATTSAIAINWGYAKVNENSVDILVDGAVSINANDGSQLNSNIQDAQELVNSVKNTDVSVSTISAKISTYS